MRLVEKKRLNTRWDFNMRACTLFKVFMVLICLMTERQFSAFNFTVVMSECEAEEEFQEEYGACVFRFSHVLCLFHLSLHFPSLMCSIVLLFYLYSLPP